ncbi:MAG: sodium:solute symporter family protein [Planctomycetota bacterium]|jgi:SSS family solute:Na+ symporter
MDPLAYQYTIGGLVFAVGLIYAARQGYVGLSGPGLRNLLILVGGLVFYIALQGYLQYAHMETVDPVAHRGDVARRSTLGTPTDYAVMAGYFLTILAVGTYFGRRQKTIRDFFFGGQRFSWWLIAFSLVATLIGSYSFVKYSRVAYEYGLSSSQSYLNDWIWLPLLVFGWLPIFYFSRLTSVPEYFQRRFGPNVRLCATILILLYLVGYVGVNLYTMGTALNILLGWKVYTAAAIVACVSAVYVTLGGQTSVIMTDLFQGVMLLAAGLLILGLGVAYLGGFDAFWHHLPRPHRLAFANFNRDPSFSGVGIFWQDAMANSAMFYFLNQGILMRFLAAKSAAEARKAALFVVLVFMPIAAGVVAAGGWVARALVHAGALPEVEPREAFFVAAEFLSRPGLFGLIVAALTAALMSTVDTLITAVSAIVVNDVYRPYLRPQAGERELLRVARISALAVTALGIALVPLYMGFKSIYAAHAAFTAAATPPLVVTLLLSVFWRRFTHTAALWTLIGGTAAVAFSFLVPEVIAPFAHGVPVGQRGPGWLGGFQQYKFMRALYGLAASGGIAVAVTLLTRPEPFERHRGLVWGTVADALRRYKGSPGSERPVTRCRAMTRLMGIDLPASPSGLPTVRISRALADAIKARPGDLLYVCDTRWWLGGLHSTHAIVADVAQAQPSGPSSHRVLLIEMGPQAHASVVRRRRSTCPVLVERLY